MPQVLAYGRITTMENSKPIIQKWSRSLKGDAGRRLRVGLTVLILLGKFWCFIDGRFIARGGQLEVEGISLNL